jgi:hypothetical protein
MVVARAERTSFQAVSYTHLLPMLPSVRWPQLYIGSWLWQLDNAGLLSSHQQSWRAVHLTAIADSR